MLVHENGKTRELTKEEVEAIDKKVEEVEKERAEQKAATEKEYAEKLKGVEPDTQEYYALQKEKADRLEAIDKEYDKKGDEVEILKDLHKQGDKPGEGSEKGKRSDISIDKDELKTAPPEEKQPNPEAGTRESKEDTKPEQDNVQETGDKTENNRESNNVKENLDENNEKPKLDVEHVAGHLKDMLVHENGKTRELTKEEVEAIDKKVEEVEKERAEQKVKADRLEAIDKEYDKKADEVEILKEMHKQGDKPEEGQEKGKRSDIAIDKDELRPATPEERKPEPAAEGKGANKETKGEAKPEQDKTQEAKESTGINQNIKENSGETKETPAYDVERVKGMPYEMGVHENGKLRSLTKEEAEQIGQRIENAEKEYAAKKAEIEAKIEEKYAKELKEAKPGSSEYYDAQRRKHEEKEAQLSALGKEYQKKTDPVEVFYGMKKQETKNGILPKEKQEQEIKNDADEPISRTEARAENEREYSIREIADKNPELRRALEDVKQEILKALPGAKDVRFEGDDIAFTMPNGSKLRVSIKDQIIISDTEAGQAKKKHAITSGRNVIVEGYKQNRGDYTLIVLSLDSSKGTMYHEAFHFAWESALSDKEKADMKKYFEQKAYSEQKGKKTKEISELMADDYKKWKLEREQHNDTLFGSCYNKISDFYYSAKSILRKTENAHNVYRRISEGDVWKRDSQERSEEKTGKDNFGNQNQTKDTKKDDISKKDNNTDNVENDRQKKLQIMKAMTLKIIEANPVSNGLYVIAKETIEGVKAINKMIDVKDDPAKVLELKEKREREMDKSFTAALNKFKEDPVYGGLYVLGKEALYSVKAVMQMVNVKDDPAKVLELKEKREQEMDKSFTVALDRFKADPVYGGLYVIAKETIEGVKAINKMIDVKDDPAKVLELKEKREQEMDKSFTAALDRFKTDPVYGGLYVIGKEIKESMKAFMQMIDVKDDPAKVLELKEKREQQREKSFDGWLGSGKNRDLSEKVDKHFHNVKKQETIQNVESTKTPEVLDIKDKLKGALNDTINSVYNEIIDKGPDFCKKIDGFVKECFDNPLLSLRVRASDGINYVFEQINNNKTVRSSIECPFYSLPNEKYSEILKGIDKDMVFKIGVQRLIPDVLQPILNLTNETSDRLNEDILQGTGNDAKDKQAPVVQIQNMLNVLYTGFSGVLLTQITDHFKASPGFTNMDVYAQMGIFTAAVLVGCGSLLMHETFKSIFDNYSKS